MILIAVPCESKDEPRVALSPETARKFIAKGCDVVIESGAGERSDMTDEDYQSAGARISKNITDDLGKADLVLGVNCPDSKTIKAIRKGAVLAATLNPTDDQKAMEELAGAGISAFAMEFMPRITRAQSMDVLSSQSNLAGYKAVIDAASAVQPRHADDDDGSWHSPTGPCIRHGSRGGWFAGDCHGAPSWGHCIGN